jgi:hypothetical protein
MLSTPLGGLMQVAINGKPTHQMARIDNATIVQANQRSDDRAQTSHHPLAAFSNLVSVSEFIPPGQSYLHGLENFSHRNHDFSTV